MFASKGRSLPKRRDKLTRLERFARDKNSTILVLLKINLVKRFITLATYVSLTPAIVVFCEKEYFWVITKTRQLTTMLSFTPGSKDINHLLS
jgi:hypothetical protein